MIRYLLILFSFVTDSAPSVRILSCVYGILQKMYYVNQFFVVAWILSQKRTILAIMGTRSRWPRPIMLIQIIVSLCLLIIIIIILIIIIIIIFIWEIIPVATTIIVTIITTTAAAKTIRRRIHHPPAPYREIRLRPLSKGCCWRLWKNVVTEVAAAAASAAPQKSIRLVVIVAVDRKSIVIIPSNTRNSRTLWN